MSLRVNSIFSSFGALIRLLITVITIPVLIRSLGLELYGIWVTINALVLVAALAELGLSTALTNMLSGKLAGQEEPAAKGLLGTTLVILIVLGITSALLLSVLSPTILNLIHISSNLVSIINAVKIYSIFVFFRLLQLWCNGIEAAYQRYDLQVAIETVGTVLSQVGLVFIAIFTQNLQVLAGWMVASSFLTLLAHMFILERVLRISYRSLFFSWVEVKPLMKFGLASWVSSVGSLLFGSVDRIIVTGLIGPESSGIYSAMTSVTSKINELSAVPIRVIPPAISAAVSTNQQDRIRQIFLLATRLNNSIVFLLAAPMMYLASLVTHYLLGESYSVPNVTIFSILAFVYGIYSLSAAGYFAAIGLGRPGVNAFWGISGGSFVCLILYLVMPGSGLLGAAWANLAYSIVLMINLMIVRNIHLNFSVYIKQFIPVVLGLLLWFGFCQLLGYLSLKITDWYISGFALLLGLTLLLFITGFENIKSFYEYMIGRLFRKRQFIDLFEK